MSKRQTKPLRDPELKKWVKDATPLAKSDGDGLTFTISDTGYASWILRYGQSGKRRELTIGRYPEISLLEARKIATQKRGLIDQGVDVATEKRREKQADIRAWNVTQLCGEYRKAVLDKRAAMTRKLHGSYISNWVVPRLGPLGVKKVTRGDVIGMLQAAHNAGRKPGAVRAMRAAARVVFQYAKNLTIIDVNPAFDIDLDAILPVPPPRKGEALAGEFLGRFLRALGDDVSGLGFRLHLITGVRPVELLGASWNEFDLQRQIWVVPAARTKTRTGYEIPLPPQAISILQKLKPLSEKSYFLFPAAYGEADRPIPYQTYRGRLRRLLPLLGDDFPKIKPHDLRRTMRSALTRLHVRYEVAERAINHKLPAMAEIYDLNDFLPDRLEALSKWAKHMDELEKGVDSAKVQ